MLEVAVFFLLFGALVVGYVVALVLAFLFVHYVDRWLKGGRSDSERWPFEI